MRSRLEKPIVVPLLLLVFLSLFSLNNCNNLKFISIDTGAVTGIYYPTGGAICRLINKNIKTLRIKATVEATAGSVYNVNAVLSGDLEFGVVQSDRQYQAFHGLSEWKHRGPQLKLRSVLSIHPETVILVATVKSGIQRIQDLKNKRVNLGNPGSGPLQNAKDALSAFAITEKELHAEYVKAVEAPGLLMDERIDAFFYTVGNPNGNIKEATSGRVQVRFIPLTGPPIDTLIRNNPYYTQTQIPIHHYPKAANQLNIPTFGVKGTLVTSADVDQELVYTVTRQIFDNLEEFKSLHPAYSSLSKKSMLTGLSAPLHPGALRYYRENGLIHHINRGLLPKNKENRE